MKHTIEKHLDESVPVRANVDRHGHQIITLEQARLSTMEDIKEIKSDLSSIKANIESLNASVKIWVLSGICGTVMAFAIPTMVLFYNAGQMAKQIQITEEKVQQQENRLYEKKQLE